MILLVKSGDFYKAIGADAAEVARVCGLVLAADGGRPMCGIGRHAIGDAVNKLIGAGYGVQIKPAQ